MSAPPALGPDDARQRRALRRDTALTAAGQLAAVASAFAVTLVGARVLTPEQFGALSWALAWLTFLAVLAEAGLTQVATIVFARQDRRSHPVLARRLLAALAAAVLVTAALWQGLLGPATAAAGSPPGVYRPLVLVVALWLPVAALGPVLVNVFRARDRFGLALAFGEHVRRVVLVAVLLVVAAGAASAGETRTALAWTAAIETAVFLVALVLLLRLVGRASTGRHAAGRPADGDAPGGPAPSAGRLLRSGGTFAVATLASVTVPQAGVWLLAVVAPAEEVAEFSVAVRIAVLVAVPTAIGMRTLAPRIAAAAGAGRLAALQEPVRRFAVWSTAVTALAVAVLAAAGSVLLPAVFGEEYREALAPALVMCAGVLVNAWTGPCSVVLSHAGRPRVVAVSALGAALGFAGLAVWWGALGGGTGVAAAAAVAMAGRNLLLARAARATLGIRTVALPARWAA